MRCPVRDRIPTLLLLWCGALACSSGPRETPGADASARDDVRSGDVVPGDGGHRPRDGASAAMRDGGGGQTPGDAGAPEAGTPEAGTPDAGHDAATPDADASGSCEYGGAPGDCINTSSCAALSDHTSFAGQCPGPEDIQCCILTPSTANNPPTPAGYMLMQQSQVTAAMTAWAVMILDAPTTYPMFSTTTMAFGTLTVLARVEWHPPDFQNSAVHRGVTLYVPV